MINIATEPSIRVGLMSGVHEVEISLHGSFETPEGEVIEAGDYTINRDSSSVRLTGEKRIQSWSLTLRPVDLDSGRVTIHGVTIGVDFHWQRKESQTFQGALLFALSEQGFVVINKLPLESYLVSVISSEMSASCPPALLRAHSIVSRSWLLAQITKASSAEHAETIAPSEQAVDELIRWYDRENHQYFDVCADDHCQRYQGITKAFSEAAFESVHETRGQLLMWGDEICDARYSKSCGGMTEKYRFAWEDKEVPYLDAVYDGAGDISAYDMPLSDERNATRWITNSPPAFCNANSPELITKILPGFDQETLDFYRWEKVYSQTELRGILESRLGLDFGHIIALEPLERGASGRISRLRIEGEKKTLVLGKELEIRRALSRSHLYSSAFIVDAARHSQAAWPDEFRLLGAGWGHGVGLCQIGAAVMAELGYGHDAILAHYFRGAQLRRVY